MSWATENWSVKLRFPFEAPYQMGEVFEIRADAVVVSVERNADVKTIGAGERMYVSQGESFVTVLLHNIERVDPDQDTKPS